MEALREDVPDDDPREEQREAHMRQPIRAAAKAGAENVAVVCGAWHAPALVAPGPAAPDARTLKGLPKTKVATTWVPWTYGRLARERLRRGGRVPRAGTTTSSTSPRTRCRAGSRGWRGCCAPRA